MHLTLIRAVPLLSLLSTALAQTFTDCNPMHSTDCPYDTALGVSNYTIDFTQSIMSTRVWNTTAGSVGTSDDGATFTIQERGDAPTVKTNFFIFFGQVEVWMKAAKGQGVVSSIVMESDDLDEVDWEWIGGNSTHVQTNYFGKGNTTSFDRAAWFPVDDPQDNWHNYTVDWSKDKLDWYIDGQMVRSLPYAKANGGHNFPQTPCNVRLGIWAGGDPKNPNGTIEWAGGLTDYTKAPFTMTVKSVRVSDASTGTQYKYGDTSGSWESIQLLNVTKPLQLDGANSGSTSQTLTQKWRSMSKTTKIVILSVVLGVIAVCACVFAFCCIRQRRAGKHEKLVEDAKFEKNTSELLAYRAEMSRVRSEKLADARMGNPGASFQYNRGGQTPVMGGMSPNVGNYNNPNYFSSNHYAPSVSTYNSGRGYQRY